jgi:hypothetical protein
MSDRDGPSRVTLERVPGKIFSSDPSQYSLLFEVLLSAKNQLDWTPLKAPKRDACDSLCPLEIFSEKSLMIYPSRYIRI